MKILKSFFLASLVLATLSLQAQDDIFEDEQPQPSQPAKWLTMSSAGLTMGFAEGWDTDGDDKNIVGVSPDGKVRITVFVSQFKTIEETVANIQHEFSSWCDGLELQVPTYTMEVNGLKLLTIGGPANMEGAKVMVSVKILETPLEGDDGIIIIATYGFNESMDQNMMGILVANNSFKRA